MTKILTVDDEVEFTALIEGYFAARGYTVFSAADGQKGMAIFLTERPQVCLIDLKMPGMHGDEMLKEIMRIEPRTKCIMITASEGEGRTRANLMDLGAYACFDKPLTSLKDLEQKIKEAVLL